MGSAGRDAGSVSAGPMAPSAFGPSAPVRAVVALVADGGEPVAGWACLTPDGSVGAGVYGRS